MSSFISQQTEQTITFNLLTAADSAFPLFGAKREMDWDNDWHPHFLAPADGNQNPDGAVFIVDNELGQSTWVMTRYDALARAVEYVRVTPEHTVGQIWIGIVATGGNVSRVNVTYRLTGLSERGNEYVTQFGAEFPTKGQVWADVINHYITTGQPLGTAYDVKPS